MKAEITFSQLWNNPSVRKFFFRQQSERTLQKLRERAADFQQALETIETYAEQNGYALDDIEEMFFSFGDNTLEALAAELEIELKEN